MRRSPPQGFLKWTNHPLETGPNNNRIPSNSRRPRQTIKDLALPKPLHPRLQASGAAVALAGDRAVLNLLQSLVLRQKTLRSFLSRCVKAGWALLRRVRRHS